MTLDAAKELSNSIIAAIQPYCLRAEVTGVVRREWECDIKRVAIIAIPDTTDADKLLTLRHIVNTRWGEPAKGAFPSKQTTINRLQKIDFFWVRKETWGYTQFFRTGAQFFVVRAITYWKRQFGGDVGGGHMYDAQGAVVPTLEEDDVFAAMQCKPIPPKSRFDDKYKKRYYA